MNREVSRNTSLWPLLPLDGRSDLAQSDQLAGERRALRSSSLMYFRRRFCLGYGAWREPHISIIEWKLPRTPPSNVIVPVNTGLESAVGAGLAPSRVSFVGPQGGWWSQAPKLIKPKMSSETPTAPNKRRLQELPSRPLTCMLLESDESKQIRTDFEVPDRWSDVSDVPLDQPQQSTSTSNIMEPHQSTSISSTDKACSNGTFHKFIVIESADDEKSFNKLSPFAIEILPLKRELRVALAK